MSTNGIDTTEEADMTECDGEKVVTMMDVLQEQEEFEEDANAVLGASDDKNCTYSKGYIKRQAIYACLTCCVEAKHDPSKRAGVCLACSLTCHENHELVELYTKRNFRCDCGNPKFNSHPCQFTPDKTELNEDNYYNQNFSGLYCICHRPYPDPESTFEDEMIQCIICEDWLHSTHLDANVPTNEQYAEMICKGCMEKNEFIHDYSDFAINNESNDIDIVAVNGSEITLANTTSDTNETLEPTVTNGVMKSSESNNKNKTKDEMDVDTPAEEKDIINEEADSDKKVLINESHMNEVEKIPESTDAVIEKAVGTDKTDSTGTLDAVDTVKTEGTDSLNEIAMDTDKTQDTDTLNAVDTDKTKDNNTLNTMSTDKTEGTDTLNDIAIDTDKIEKDINSDMKNTEKSNETMQPEANKDSSESLVNNYENKSDNISSDDEISSKENDTITDRSKETSDLKSETEQNLEEKVNNETENSEQTETSTFKEECDKDERSIDGSNSNMDQSKLNFVEGDTIQQVSNASDMETNENKSEELPEKANLDCIEEPVEDAENKDKVAESSEPVIAKVDEKKDDKEPNRMADIKPNRMADIKPNDTADIKPNEIADIENHEKYPTESDTVSAQKPKESGVESAPIKSGLESATTESGLNLNLSVPKNEIESKPAIESEPTKTGNGCLPSESENQSVPVETADQSVPVETEVQSAPVENEATQIASNQSSNKNDQVSEDSELSNVQENKRKLSTEQSETDKIVTKKAKLDESMQCVRPKGIKRRFKGATFWPSNFRQKLCTCNECISMYKDLSVLFLIDPEDTVTAYETLGKEKINGAPASQYEKGLLALSSLDRVQQINALTEYNKMRDKLLDFLKSFKDRKEIVKEEDIKAFFAGMKPKREPDGVYFCR